MSARKAPAPVPTHHRPPPVAKKSNPRHTPHQLVVIRLPWLEEIRRHPPANTATHDLPRRYAPAPAPPPSRDCRDGPPEKYWTRSNTPR